MCFRPAAIEAAPRKCGSCGEEVADITKTECPKCGAKLNAAPAAPGAPGAPAAPGAPGAPKPPGAPGAPAAPGAPKPPGA